MHAHDSPLKLSSNIYLSIQIKEYTICEAKLVGNIIIKQMYKPVFLVLSVFFLLVSSFLLLLKLHVAFGLLFQLPFAY